MLLPAPTVFAASTPVLWQDFVQTALKGALGGYVLGCGAVAIMLARPVLEE